jgi:hypothetical protein
MNNQHGLQKIELPDFVNFVRKVVVVRLVVHAVGGDVEVAWNLENK